MCKKHKNKQAISLRAIYVCGIYVFWKKIKQFFEPQLHRCYAYVSI